ncbi:MAG: transporter permease [Clostridiales bacterium]|jgi:ABC-2 type transport system permease protein|nr:transporter permease [Clostridiales bacterium]
MRGYTAFVKKEILESIRTYKLLIVVAAFFIFGMMSPLMAKLMPEIFSKLATEGMIITIPEPTAIDSYTQFFKNLTQMGLVVLVLVFSGILSTEYSKGTLINVLTKGLSRHAVILAKYTVYLGLWTVSLAVSFLTAYGYTEYLFKQDGIVNLLFSVFCLWIFGAFLLSIFLFTATLIKSNYGSMLLTVMVIGLLFIMNIIPMLQKYNPVALISNNVIMLTSPYDLSNIYVSMIITGIFTIGFLCSSLLVFKKKSI